MANKQTVPVKDKDKSKETSILRHPMQEVEKTFERLMENGWHWPTTWHMRNFPVPDNLFEFEGSRLPKLNMVDRKNEILVRAEVPGINKKDIDVSLSENILTVKGHANTEKKGEEGDYHRHEIFSSSFARSISLPDNVDKSKVAASLKDGVLEVTMPKAKASKKRSIKVQ